MSLHKTNDLNVTNSEASQMISQLSMLEEKIPHVGKSLYIHKTDICMDNQVSGLTQLPRHQNVSLTHSENMTQNK